MMSPSTSRLLGSFTRCIAALLRAPATPAPPVLGCRAQPTCEPLRLSGLAYAGYPRSLSGPTIAFIGRECRRRDLDTGDCMYSYDGISPSGAIDLVKAEPAAARSILRPPLAAPPSNR